MLEVLPFHPRSLKSLGLDLDHLRFRLGLLRPRLTIITIEDLDIHLLGLLLLGLLLNLLRLGRDFLLSRQILSA